MVVHSDADELEFMDEQHENSAVQTSDAWRILIVDDEADIHSVTVMALAGFNFLGRPLHITHAYSGVEARKILDKSDDFSVILLDVVMESDNAGLILARHIRDELQNSILQIILRTGHPLTVSESDAECKYGCNYYELKTNVTTERLNTLLTLALSAYSSACVNEGSHYESRIAQ